MPVASHINLRDTELNFYAVILPGIGIYMSHVRFDLDKKVLMQMIFELFWVMHEIK